ncbi:acetone carboxylase subunit gamma [Chloroflexota bacterium]
MRIHEYLEIVSKKDGSKVVRCVKCGHEFCDPRENYKEHALIWERNLDDVSLRAPVSGEPMFTCYQEFICPSCGTLLEVDVFCPGLDQDEPIVWDIQIRM